MVMDAARCYSTEPSVSPESCSALQRLTSKKFILLMLIKVLGNISFLLAARAPPLCGIFIGCDADNSMCDENTVFGSECDSTEVVRSFGRKDIGLCSDSPSILTAIQARAIFTTMPPFPACCAVLAELCTPSETRTREPTAIFSMSLFISLSTFTPVPYASLRIPPSRVRFLRFLLFSRSLEPRDARVVVIRSI